MEPLLLRALKRTPVERPPVWLMRQAGRYMEEYRRVKEKHGFLGICRSPELALEVTMQPIHYLDPDAAIVFADILLPAEAMGFEIDFQPGPKLNNPINSPDDIAHLRVKDVASALAHVTQAVKLVRTELGSMAASGQPRKALLGFAGAPWTMACYLLDQGPYKHFLGTSVFAARHPAAMEQLLQLLTNLTAEYLVLQHEQGADAVQLFDTWAGGLSNEAYRRWALPFTQQIVTELSSRGCPVVLYVNGSSQLIEPMLESGADAISIDWRTDLPTAFAAARGRAAVQGNFDPTLLFSDEDDIAERTNAMLRSLPDRTGFLANLGHGILPGTPPANVRRFVDTVKAWREQ